MSILSDLAMPGFLIGTLVASGILFFALLAVQSRTPSAGAGRFVLNLLSLPLGVAAIAATVVQWSALSVVAIAIALVAGAVLAGRSLRELPWTGLLALATGVLVGYGVYAAAPGALTVLEVVGVGAIAFLVVYALLYLIELPLRLAGFLSVPRPVLAALGLSSLAGAALVAGSL